MDLEGKFHGIVAGDGRRLNPLNLDHSLRRDGTVIEGGAQVRDDVAGIRQRETIVLLVYQNAVPAGGR